VVKTYESFDDPNFPGRLIKIADRNGNVMTFHYRQIDPDETDADASDIKSILAFVIDTMGREIRYQYYAKLSNPGVPQTDADGRVLTLHNTSSGALGRLARVKDFKGDMDFDGNAESEDFAGQVNNRTLRFQYDGEGNLIDVIGPAVAGTPNGNDFANGKTTSYTYLGEFDIDVGITGLDRERLLHNLNSVTTPNETWIANGNPREELTFGMNPTDPNTFDRVLTYILGGSNENSVDAGGTISYDYIIVAEDANSPSDVYLHIDVTDRRGNMSEYEYSAFDTLLKKRELTGGLRTGEPAAFESVSNFNGDKERVEVVRAEGNLIQMVFNDQSTDRFQQGNIIRQIKTPDSGRASQTDQAKIENVFVYEPIYNRPCLVIFGRGADIDNNDFIPPLADPAAVVRQVPDPYDAGKTIDLRYVLVEYFDYQESTEKAAAAPDERLDIDGTGGLVNASPLITNDPNVLTVEVWLVHELGLSEDAAGLSELRGRLSNNMTTLGLGDLNSDGLEGVKDEHGDVAPTIAGNVVRTVFGSPVLIEGSNQHALEEQIETAGDLVNEALGYMEGGTQEGAYGNRLQTVVTMQQHNRFGQLIKQISPEGNVTVYDYYPEIDPDGDGYFSLEVGDLTGDCFINWLDFTLFSLSWQLGTCVFPTWCGGADINQNGVVDADDLDLLASLWLSCVNTAADGRTLAGDTGGYLRQIVWDAARLYNGQGDPSLIDSAFSNNNADPVITQIATRFTYDDVGNLTSMTNGRGIRTDYFVNELDQVVQTTWAADVALAAAADPADPLVGASVGPLTAFAYVSRTFYDFDDNVVLLQTEDRGNTSSVDGNGLGSLPFQATETTPGLDNADATGGVAFVDTLYLYDVLGYRIETRQEVDNTHALETLYRYDAGENQVLIVHPEGNAYSYVFDERDLLFTSTSGADVRPSEGLYAFDDPTTFDRPGGVGTVASTTTYNYDKNENLIEEVDAIDNGGTASTIAGIGDVKRYSYDGYDRLKSVTDPLGNATVYVYDPDHNVVRVIRNGDPNDDVAGDGQNKTLSITEIVYDAISREYAKHLVLFETPDVALIRTAVLTDTVAMDNLAPYLGDAGFDSSAVPGALPGNNVIGRVTLITEYDRANRLTFVIQDDLDLLRTDYDGFDRLVKTSDSFLANGYTPGSPGAFDPNAISGNTIEIAYDDNDNLIEQLATDVTSVSGVTSETFRTTSFYDALDRLQTQVDNRGQTLDFRYDSRNNLVSAADAFGPVTGRSVSRRGLGSSAAVSVNDFGNVERKSYDGIDRLVETEKVLTANSQGDGVHVGASLEGLKDVGGASGQPTPDTTQSEDGLINKYQAWDDNSQILALRDDDGNTSAYIYDNQDRQLAKIEGLAFTGTAFGPITGPASSKTGDSGAFSVTLRNAAPIDAPFDSEFDGTETQTGYDPDFNIVSNVDEAGNAFTQTYDALDRMKTRTIIRAAGFVGTTQQSWQYDGLNRMTLCFDNNEPSSLADDVTETNAFGSLSRRIESTQQVGAAAAVKVVSCAYDIEAGGTEFNCTTCTYPDGRQVVSMYDRLDRLVSRADADGGSGTFAAIGSYEYVGIGRIATLTYQNDTRLTFIGQDGGNADVGYDNLRRVVNKRWEKINGQPLGAGALLVGFGHELGAGAGGGPAYDRMNNQLIEEKLHDSGNSEVYVYDSQYRLRDTGKKDYRNIKNGFRRGTLNAGKTDIATLTSTSPLLKTKDWKLDGVSNWEENTTKYTAGGFAGGKQVRKDT
ncbi:MAG: hypothetical protein IID32_03360, partial [Planctomycetes bacterium]|nr:hypothetical protein [Planctomycetota bacterium]